MIYPHFAVIPVSKFLCPKSIIILIPQNHLNELWFTFSDEVIKNLRFFSLKYTK